MYMDGQPEERGAPDSSHCIPYVKAAQVGGDMSWSSSWVGWGTGLLDGLLAKGMNSQTSVFAGAREDVGRTG